MVRNLFCLTSALATLVFLAAPAVAQFEPGNSPNNLFSQYYTQPGASQTQAAMYNAPHWVPSYTGHSYHTYQPLMPHEMMYQHNRNYYNYYNTGGFYGSPNALNKTQVRWQSGSNHMGPIPWSGNLGQGLAWKFNRQRYNLGDGSGGVLGGVRGHLHGAGSRLHGLHHGLHRHHSHCQGSDCIGNESGHSAAEGCNDCQSGQSVVGEHYQ